jgi:hypothetical protein
MSKPKANPRQNMFRPGEYRRELSKDARKDIAAAYNIKDGDLVPLVEKLETAMARCLAYDANRRPTPAVERDALETIERQARDLHESLSLHETSALQRAPLLLSEMRSCGLNRADLVKQSALLAGLCRSVAAEVPKTGGRPADLLSGELAKATAGVLVDAGLDIGDRSGFPRILETMFAAAGCAKADIRKQVADARRRLVPDR